MCAGSPLNTMKLGATIARGAPPANFRWTVAPWIGLGLILLATSLAKAGAAETWTLPQILNHARTNSPDARLAQIRITAARAGLQQAEAAFWPRLQFQSSYTRTDNPMQVFGAALNQRSYSSSLDFNDVPDADNLNVRGLVTVPLYSGGRNAAGRESAQASAAAARWEAEAVHEDLAFEATRSFHMIHKTRRYLAAAEASVRSFVSNLNIASNRFEGGAALRIEVLDLEVRLAQSREELARARHAESLARRALRNLLGIEQGEFEVAEVSPAVAVPDPDSSFPSRRPELLALREQARAAQAGIERARGGYKPNLHAFGSADYNRGWEFDGDGRSYTAGVLLQWDIWDGQLTKGKVNAARAQLESVLEQERKVKLAIDLDLEQARLRHREAAERLAVTEKSVEQAEESAVLTRARFEQGLVLASQLIDAETALTAARVRRAEAEADQSIAVAAWRKALGLPQLDENSNL